LGKLKVLSGQEICEILSSHGFKIVRQRGSHIAMQKKSGISTITVLIPNHKEIKIGTLKSIIRQSKLPSSEFEV
jgi:predicted RNA binding protein YcfA (HicA-like mRNA interferase family)